MKFKQQSGKEPERIPEDTVKRKLDKLVYEGVELNRINVKQKTKHNMRRD